MQILKKKKKGDAPPAKPRYFYSDNEITNMGTAEQRLGDALVSGGKDVNDLMTLLNVMGTDEYIAPSAFNIDFGDTEGEYYEPLSQSRGRAYADPTGMAMYQPPSEEEGLYEGTGRTPTKEDVREIAGTTTAKSSDLTKAAKLLRDPAVLRYFMDIENEAGEARDPNIITLKPKRQKTSGTGGCTTLHIIDGKPKIKIDPSCRGPKSWQQ